MTAGVSDALHGGAAERSTPICLGEKAKGSKSRDARAAFVGNEGQPEMGDRGELQPQLLMLKGRTLRAKGVSCTSAWR
jgi:hypothetical protein